VNFRCFREPLSPLVLPFLNAQELGDRAQMVVFTLSSSCSMSKDNIQPQIFLGNFIQNIGLVASECLIAPD
jgi:hypothetical protein